jgi:hypothetical protein
MTKKEAIQQFKKTILPLVHARFRKNDKAAIREAWNNWTDGLCKDGRITSKQYHNWTGPF